MHGCVSTADVLLRSDRDGLYHNTPAHHPCSTFFWPQEEPSRAYTQGTEWPRYGGCVVASARTHGRGERQDSRSGTYRTAFTGHKGPRLNTIVPFYPRVPNYLQKVGQHTQKTSRRNGGGGYSSCHRALRKAASTIVAQRRTSPVFVQTM